jgi:hypothetical protein
MPFRSVVLLALSFGMVAGAQSAQTTQPLPRQSAMTVPVLQAAPPLVRPPVTTPCRPTTVPPGRVGAVPPGPPDPLPGCRPSAS